VKCVILAAGYATRLYPLTLDRPKALLPVAGKPMLEHLLARLEEVPLEDVLVVTNSKFARAFEEWAAARGGGVHVLDDGTRDDETRLGAIGDLDLAIREATTCSCWPGTISSARASRRSPSSAEARARRR
jgi:glucose-1-phosphate thymidylyltransferase